MICRHCDQLNADDASFCQNCGKGLAPEPRSCAKCGANSSPTAKFCLNCGAALTSNASSPSTGSEQPKKVLPLHLIDEPPAPKPEPARDWRDRLSPRMKNALSWIVAIVVGIVVLTFIEWLIRGR
jgi:uncharacterized membrane protein YvbJ